MQSITATSNGSSCTDNFVLTSTALLFLRDHARAKRKTGDSGGFLLKNHVCMMMHISPLSKQPGTAEIHEVPVFVRQNRCSRRWMTQTMGTSLTSAMMTATLTRATPSSPCAPPAATAAAVAGACRCALPPTWVDLFPMPLLKYVLVVCQMPVDVCVYLMESLGAAWHTGVAVPHSRIQASFACMLPGCSKAATKQECFCTSILCMHVPSLHFCSQGATKLHGSSAPLYGMLGLRVKAAVT